MKKITLSAIALAAIFTVTTLTSCGGGESHEATEETTTEEVAVEETVVEEVVEETAAVDTEAGKEKFTTSGCVACHQVEAKTVGPALKDIATAYADNKDGLVAFLNGEGEAIVDPAQAAVMAPQTEVTKAMTDAERNSIADYIMAAK
jgi:cytochrome c